VVSDEELWVQRDEVWTNWVTTRTHAPESLSRGKLTLLEFQEGMGLAGRVCEAFVDDTTLPHYPAYAMSLDGILVSKTKPRPAREVGRDFDASFLGRPFLNAPGVYWVIARSEW